MRHFHDNFTRVVVVFSQLHRHSLPSMDASSAPHSFNLCERDFALLYDNFQLSPSSVESAWRDGLGKTKCELKLNRENCINALRKSTVIRNDLMMTIKSWQFSLRYANVLMRAISSPHIHFLIIILWFYQINDMSAKWKNHRNKAVWFRNCSTWESIIHLCQRRAIVILQAQKITQWSSTRRSLWCTQSCGKIMEKNQFLFLASTELHHHHWSRVSMRCFQTKQKLRFQSSWCVRGQNW